jgi:DNA uptake protein ComE-like DNA-binding protein
MIMNGKRGGWRRWQGWLHPVAARLKQNSRVRLHSEEEVSVAATLGVRIDVNQATVDDWLRLPGLSIHQAHRLVQHVEQGEALLCLEDIATALGVPEATLQPLAPILQFCYYETAPNASRPRRFL